MSRLERLAHLRHVALWHELAAESGTLARRIRSARARRITAAYHAELARTLDA